MDNTKPLTGYERFLEAAGDGSDNQLKPVTRREHVLDSIAKGEPFTDPHTREEYFLAKLSDAMHGGGGESHNDDVVLYDFDGTVIASYSASDFAKLKAYPAHPEHEYLTSDGYNWELEDAKEFVAENGVLDIGAQYETKPNPRIFPSLKGTSYIFLECLAPNQAITLSTAGPYYTSKIDWGDGSSESVRKTPVTHTYSNVGTYVCSINTNRLPATLSISGSCRFNGLYIGDHYFGDFNIEGDFFYGLSFLMLARSSDSTANTIVTLAQIVGSCTKHVTIPSNIRYCTENLFDYTSQNKSRNPGIQHVCLPKDFSGLRADMTFASHEYVKGELSLNALGDLERIVIPDGVTKVSNTYGSHTVRFSSVRLPANLESINLGSVLTLKDVKLPTRPIQFDEGAFMGCDCLESVTMQYPNPLSKNMFYGCHMLSKIELPEGIEEIPEYAFWECLNLRSVKIPDTVKSIGQNAFSRCANLSSVNIPEAVTSIAPSAFSSASRLCHIELPDGLTSIGDYAFYLTGLVDVYIPASVTSIGSNAFAPTYGLNLGNNPIRIRCGFAEGAVSGAPWGATGATIIYNATRE